MAEAEDTTPKTDTEAHPEAKQQPAVQQQEEAKTAPQPPVGDLEAKPGETLEAYAARIRSEIEWRDKQINRQHRKLKESEAQAIRAAEEAQRQPPPQPTPSATAVPQQQQIPTPQQFNQPQETVVRAKVKEELRRERISRAEERLAGNPEWPAALANFQKAGSIPEEIVDDILGTDDPSAVFLALGKDMGKFQSLLDMPENRRRAVIYQIGMSLEQKPEPKPAARKPSEAPAPVAALPSGGAAVQAEGDIDLYDPKYANSEHDQAWYDMRARQKANSRGRPWSYGGKSGQGVTR